MGSAAGPAEVEAEAERTAAALDRIGETVPPLVYPPPPFEEADLGQSEGVEDERESVSAALEEEAADEEAPTGSKQPGKKKVSKKKDKVRKEEPQAAFLPRIVTPPVARGAGKGGKK